MVVEGGAGVRRSGRRSNDLGDIRKGSIQNYSVQKKKEKGIVGTFKSDI